jgi:hypothetical protein
VPCNIILSIRFYLDLFLLQYQKLRARRSLLPSQTTINQYYIPDCPIDIPVCKMQYLCRLIKPACVLLTGNRGTCIALASLVAVPPCLTIERCRCYLFNYAMLIINNFTFLSIGFSAPSQWQ